MRIILDVAFQGSTKRQQVIIGPEWGSDTFKISRSRELAKNMNRAFAPGQEFSFEVGPGTGAVVLFEVLRRAGAAVVPGSQRAAR